MKYKFSIAVEPEALTPMPPQIAKIIHYPVCLYLHIARVPQQMSCILFPCMTYDLLPTKQLNQLQVQYVISNPSTHSFLQ
jgi:hypothetical protein